MKNKTKFMWPCYHCDKKNISEYKVVFDTTKSYHIDEVCSGCNKITRLWFSFMTEIKS